MPTTTPDQEERIKQLRAELEKLGDSSITIKSMPADMEEEFLRHVLEYERAEPITILRLLENAGYQMPPPDTLDDQQIDIKLGEALSKAATYRVYILHTNHLTSRELYTYLLNEGFREEAVLFPENANYSYIIDLTGSGSDADTQTWLKHFPAVRPQPKPGGPGQCRTNESTRRRWPAKCSKPSPKATRPFPRSNTRQDARQTAPATRSPCSSPKISFASKTATAQGAICQRRALRSNGEKIRAAHGASQRPRFHSPRYEDSCRRASRQRHTHLRASKDKWKTPRQTQQHGLTARLMPTAAHHSAISSLRMSE